MPRPDKWSREVHSIRERAVKSRTETWSRQDLEALFSIGPSSAQTLMKSIGQVQAVGGTHFVDRGSLLEFLHEMTQAESVETALRARQEKTTPIPRSAPLRVALPPELRRAVLEDLTENIDVRRGQVSVSGAGAEEVIEGLLLLARVLQNDLERVRARLDPPAASVDVDEGLRAMLFNMRRESREV